MENNSSPNKELRRKWMDSIGFCLGWFAIIGQFILMLQNRQTAILETIVRFFSFFTILTNILVALYFTTRLPIFETTALTKFYKKGSLTALTVFILVVGLVYQIVLRSTWHPTGLQKIIDELLHSVIPIFVLGYWFLFANNSDMKFKNSKIWLWFPLLYFVFVVARGHFSKFYPYPFVDVPALGYYQVFINFLIVSAFFLFILGTLLLIGRSIKK
ncbi:Pr6Pr family membrane protein [Flavobacterium sp. K77]|uniref:Pr6Pr family membrane protein n=1 Tax=Flavobacterium sp. K77 TaxID=2910676 RepID=UPI001F301CD3|nr:Pr6Pr family membrane protein [Flavobacterium sp. K77]MCF6141065.1 Pr6Pr family membrane protein [Flavobacterium sp. K77]